MKTKINLSTILVYFVASVFFIVGFLKLFDPLSTYNSMQDIIKLLGIKSFQIPLSYGVAILLPIWEISVAFGLFIKKYRKISAQTLFFTTGFFILLGHIIMWKQSNISCGCFGSLSKSFDHYHLLFLYLVIIILIIEIYNHNRIRRTKSI